MRRNASVFVESLIVFIIILSCIFIAIPFYIKSNKQEKYIVEWGNEYSNIKYVYDVLVAQNDNTFLSSDFQTKILTYLRANNPVKKNLYRQNFMNRKAGNKLYSFDNFMLTDKGEVFSFKWVNPNCVDNQICAIMSIDVNGLKQPNKWGIDVFGVNFYSDKVEPMGKKLNIREIRKDCSKLGSGVYCSTYYLIGGMIEK